MSGILLRGSRSCRLSFPIRQKTGSLKITALACTCLRIQAAQLLQDLEQDKKVQEDLEGLWCDGQLAVLKKALTAAVELGTGLLEATEVVEPDPISPNESTSYSNLYHCDRDGVYLYIDMAMKQIAQAMGKDADDR